MKRILATKSKSLARGFAAILLVSASLVPFASADSGEVVLTAGSVSYVSGGVGTESIDRLNSVARDFNLKLVFALQSGEYVSGVGIVIADTRGRTLLDTTSDGPWFLAKLPAGNYRVVATFAGKAEKRSIAIGTGTHRTINFRWTSE